MNKPIAPSKKAGAKKKEAVKKTASGPSPAKKRKPPEKSAKKERKPPPSTKTPAKTIKTGEQSASRSAKASGKTSVKKSSAKKAQALPGAAAKKIVRPKAAGKTKTASGKTEKISAGKAAIPTIKSPQRTKEKKQIKPAKTKALKTTGKKKVEDRLPAEKAAISGQLSAVSRTKRGKGRGPKGKAAVSGRQSVISKTTKSKGRVSRGKTAINNQLSSIIETKKGQGRMPEGKGLAKDKMGFININRTGLPGEYGENEVILMPVDPRVLFVDWEIKEEEFPAVTNRLAMRAFDLTGNEATATSAGLFRDFDLEDRVGCGFFDLKMPGSEVAVEIGFYDNDIFLPILRSRIVSMPRLFESHELGTDQELSEASLPVGY